MYSKCSKDSNTFLFLYLTKLLVIRAGIHEMLVSLANSEDPDQTASEEEVWRGLHCLPILHPEFYPVCLQHSRHMHVPSIRVANSVDPDQMVSSEASWSVDRSTMFSKRNKSRLSMTRFSSNMTWHRNVHKCPQRNWSCIRHIWGKLFVI